MTIDEYVTSVKELLIASDIIEEFRIVRERVTTYDAHLRVRVWLIRGHSLEFSEYVRRRPDGQPAVTTYSYHWSDEQRVLVCRWDNALHHPALPNYPHHIHRGSEGTVEPGAPVDIFQILDEIRSTLASLPPEL